MSADDEKEEKQILPMSIILTADELIEKYLFKDEIRIDIAKSVSMLRSVNSDNEQQRAYDCICDICMINNYRFRDDEKERWGSKELIDGQLYVYFISTSFKKVMKKEGFDHKVFLTWANKQGLLKTNLGRNTIIKRYGEETARCIQRNVTGGSL